MELFTKIVDCIQPLTIFTKHFMLFFLQGYEYASNKTQQNPGVLSFISQKIRTAISANFFLNLILSSHYYLAVRHQSQSQCTCLSFQNDSPFQMNTYNINQPLFKLIASFSNFFGESREIQSKLQNIVLLTLW